jgi:hypothetical protein
MGHKPNVLSFKVQIMKQRKGIALAGKFFASADCFNELGQSRWCDDKRA